nr:uncharacterized protein LOC108055568 [Drosophila takahashii]
MSYSFMILGILATIILPEVIANEKDICRKLVQTFPFPTTLEGKMIQRSFYMDPKHAVHYYQTLNSKLNICIPVSLAHFLLKEYSVIGTDNKDFVVLHKCYYDNESVAYKEYINTYTRQKFPSAETLAAIREVYKRNGLDESRMSVLCQR